MTEEEWSTSRHAFWLIEGLKRTFRIDRAKAGRRRLRLYGCACLRRVWDLLEDQGRGIIQRLERVADGLEPQSGLTELDELAARRVRYTRSKQPWDREARLAVRFAVAATETIPCAMYAGDLVGLIRALSLVAKSPEMTSRAIQERAREVHQAENALSLETLRDIFGNPFRPLPVRKFPGEVRGLAQSWLHGDAAVLPVLIDALTDLGEDGAAAHLRQPLHVRGCHVIDWVLGRP